MTDRELFRTVCVHHALFLGLAGRVPRWDVAAGDAHGFHAPAARAERVASFETVRHTMARLPPGSAAAA